MVRDIYSARTGMTVRVTKDGQFVTLIPEATSRVR